MNRSGEHVAWMVRGLVLLAAGLSVAACASANKSALKLASAESSASFIAGDYGKAIEPYRTLYEKDRTNGRAVASYIAVIEDVKKAGDQNRNEGRYASAQSAYRALADSWSGYSALAPRLSFNKADLEAGLKDCQMAACERQFRQEIGSGNYAKALAAYHAVLGDYPGDKSVKARYAKGVAEVAEMGARALAAKDFALAGKINALLLKNLDLSAEVAGPAAGGWLSRQELEAALNVCSAELTNIGLTEYRKGNLESAIAVWSSILTFEPENAEVKRAVETAKAQLARLRGSSPGGRKNAESGRGIRKTL